MKSIGFLVAIGLLVVGCGERLNPNYCDPQDPAACRNTQMCHPVYNKCVPIMMADANANRPAVDARAAGNNVAQSMGGASGGASMGGGGASGGMGAVGVGGGMSGGGGGAGAVDAPVATDGRGGGGGMMMVAVDAVGTCGSERDCPNGQPCSNGRCVECTSNMQCTGGMKVCVMNVCVECMGDGDCKEATKPFCAFGKCQTCGAMPTMCEMRAGTPVCSSTGACVECTANANCKTASKPVCVAEKCVSCAMSQGGCAAKQPGTVCNTTSGECVECVTSSDCKDSGKPVCVANKCEPCSKGAGSACAMKNAALPVCNATSGACVECTADAECKESGKPVCVANKCEPCSKGAGNACATKNAALPVCNATSGACEECGTSADCKEAGKPICAGSVCRRCGTDMECVAKGVGPGVCMSHQDGRCATDAETIYVQRTPACGATGSAAVPVCNLSGVMGLLSPSRRVVVVRGLVAGGAWTVTGSQVSVIGQMAGSIFGGVDPGLKINAGDVFVRGLTFLGGAGVTGIGIHAKGSETTLRLDGVTVSNNAGGGILLDGARFDIRNTTVSGNGPGTFGVASWGGIVVNNPPVGGPARLERVTVKDNKGGGVICSAAVQGINVSASNNMAIQDITPPCGFMSCGAPSGTCGAP